MEITNKKLLDHWNEMAKMENHITGIFHHSKIRELRNRNNERIKTLNEKLTKLQNEFFVIEENTVKTETVKIKVPQPKKDFWQKVGLKKYAAAADRSEEKPMMQEGKTLEDYLAKEKEILEAKVNIET